LKPMETYGNILKPMETYGNLWKPMEPPWLKKPSNQPQQRGSTARSCCCDGRAEIGPLLRDGVSAMGRNSRAELGECGHNQHGMLG
jgi:hypothetical protein